MNLLNLAQHSFLNLPAIENNGANSFKKVQKFPERVGKKKSRKEYTKKIKLLIYRLFSIRKKVS